MPHKTPTHKTVELSLFYFKKGDDLAFHLKKNADDLLAALADHAAIGTKKLTLVAVPALE